jgi:hypothetical protein
MLLMEQETLNASDVTGKLSGNKYIPKFHQRKSQAPIVFTCTNSIHTSLILISIKHLFRGKKEQIK